MIIYQPLGPDDVALVRDLVPSKQNKIKFCDTYKTNFLAYNACNKEGWAIFRNEIFTPDGLTKFCSYTKDKNWRRSCYMSLMNPITDQKVVYDNDINWIVLTAAGATGGTTGTLETISKALNRFGIISPN